MASWKPWYVKGLKFMQKPRRMLIIVAAFCAACLGAALYLQHYLNVAACPLCVMQRYAFLLIALSCLVGWVFNAPRVTASFSLFSSLSGTGMAVWLLWTNANPSLSCGSDPIGEVLNHFVTAKWFPYLFSAEGLCGQDNRLLLGLTTPQWALVAFVLVSLILVRIIVQTKARRGRA